jgi:TonB family protein
LPKETKLTDLKSLKNSKKNKYKTIPGDRALPLVSQRGAPIYPKSALNSELTGKVLVKATINTKGQPEKIKILKSSGHAILDNAFMETIKKYYLFKPKIKDGKAVAGEIELEYTYRL